MRYFFLLIFVIILVSAVSGCQRKPEVPVVAQINERAITLDEFKSELDRSLAIDPEFKGSLEDREDLVEELVTRELLIQEAMKKDLDSEPDFRFQIKNYFEQTLIEELMRAKLEDFATDISGEEIKERYGLMGKVYRMDVAQVEVPGIPGTCIRTDNALWQKIAGAECRHCHGLVIDKDMEIMLEYFPRDFSDTVFDLAPGEVSKPVLLQGKFCYVKLREVEDISLPPLSDVRGQISDSLLREKQAERMEKWMRGLREKAEININNEVLDDARLDYEQ
jgi:peptidyl-prolyl cis-trans isomerase C